MTLLHGSFFSHKLDNRPTPLDGTWEEIVGLWQDLAQVERERVEKDGLQNDGKNFTVWPSCPAICPAEYEGDLRRKHLVQRWHWFAADVDNEDGAPYLSIEGAEAIMRDLGVAHCLHSTTKSKPERHRYRLMCRLARPIEADEYPDAWASISEMIGGGKVFDLRTRDPSRLFFVPARWVGADWKFIAGDGDGLDVDWVRRTYPVAPQQPVKPPAPLATPEKIRAVADARAKAFGTTSGSDMTNPLTSPFVSEKMRDEYMRAPEGGRFYRFMAQAAVRALGQGYPITASELEEIGLNMDAVVTGKRRSNTAHEAQNALNFAASRVDASSHAGRTPLVRPEFSNLKF